MYQRDPVQRVALLFLILAKPALASRYPDLRPVALGLTAFIALFSTGFAWSVIQSAGRRLGGDGACLATVAGFTLGSLSIGLLLSSGLDWGNVLLGWATLTFFTSAGGVGLLSRSCEVEDLSSGIGYKAPQP